MENRKELSEKELEQIVGGGGTGAGMAKWAHQAYCERWSYVWGEKEPGSVDSSGLISSYAGGANNTEIMFSLAPVKGPISTMPEQPGLGLYMPGHVGVYVGSGMAVSAESEDTGVVERSVGSCGWTHWFQIPRVSY